jgi:hypothetical protein
MKTYITKYCVTYWTEWNDESTDIEIIIEAYNIEEALKLFLDMNLVYKKIDNIRELV